MEQLIKNIEQYIARNPILKSEGLYPELLLNKIQKIKKDYIEFNGVIPVDIESTIDKIIQIINVYLNNSFDSDRYSTYLNDIDKIIIDLTNDKILTPNYEFIIIKYFNSIINDYLVSKQEQSQVIGEFDNLKILADNFFDFEVSSINLTENLKYNSPVDFKINEVNLFFKDASTPYRNKFVYSVLTTLHEIQKIFDEKKSILTIGVDLKEYSFRHKEADVASLKKNLRNLDEQICFLLKKFEISPHKSRRYPTINIEFEKCKESLSSIITDVTPEKIHSVNNKLEILLAKLKSYD